MTEESDLIAAIITNRDEDTPRLMYADWLQEHSREVEAEFISVQCEIAREMTGWEGVTPATLDMYLDPQDRDSQRWKHHVQGLVAREQALIKNLAILPRVFRERSYSRETSNWMTLDRYSRGLWAKWLISSSAFLEFADAIIWDPDSGVECQITAAPLEVITLVTPYTDDSENMLKARAWRNDPRDWRGRPVSELWRAEWPTLVFQENWNPAMNQFHSEVIQ